METQQPEQPKVGDRASRSFSSIFLSANGKNVRRRRGTDVSRVVISLLVLLYLGLLVSSNGAAQKAISDVFYPPNLGFTWLVTLLWLLCSYGTIILLVAVALFGRRREILRDLFAAAGIALLLSFGFQEIFGVAARLPQSTAQTLHGVDLGFPVPILSASVALVLVALPFLSRGFQRVLEGAIFVAVVSGLIHGSGLPISLLGSLAAGWAAAAGVHLLFGSPTGLPSIEGIKDSLSLLRISATEIRLADHQEWGPARYRARSDDGSELRVTLYGRDAQESQMFSKLYRMIFLRNDSGVFSLTRLQQVEHECYLTMLAHGAAPGATSTINASGMVGPQDNGVVVTMLPGGKTLVQVEDDGDDVSDRAIASLFDILKNFQTQGIVHGSLNLDRITIQGDQAILSDFDRSLNYGSSDALHRDVAAAMCSMAIVVGADRTAAAAVSQLGKEVVADALPYLQSPALPTSLSVSLRSKHQKSLLKELRESGAKLVGVDVPKLAELHRVSWTNMILAVGTLIGGWALIGVFLHVAQSASTLAHANWFWVTVTALIAQVAYFGSAMSTLGSITAVVPYFPIVVLELSNTFSGLALGSPAVLAARIRFFQKQGVDTTIAVSSGVLVSTASWIVKGGLFLISIPFALGSLHFESLTKSSSSNSDQKILEIGLLCVLAIGVVVIVGLAVPRWRRLVAEKLVPRFHEVVSHFKVLIHQPAKIVEIFGGMLIAQLVMALALGASLHAFGEHLSLPVLLVVLTIGSILGGISPVPGGMGVVEAGMILGLKAAGIPASIAVAAVFVQRLFTAYLPPIAGWFSLMWLRRKEYI